MQKGVMWFTKAVITGKAILQGKKNKGQNRSRDSLPALGRSWTPQTNNQPISQEKNQGSTMMSWGYWGESVYKKIAFDCQTGKTLLKRKMGKSKN